MKICLIASMGECSNIFVFPEIDGSNFYFMLLIQKKSRGITCHEIFFECVSVYHSLTFTTLLPTFTM